MTLEFLCRHCLKVSSNPMSVANMWCSNCDKHHDETITDDTFDPLWLTASGEVLRISEMQDSHLRNCVAKCFLSTTSWRGRYLPYLLRELTRRQRHQLLEEVSHEEA
jgi:hypothetical protein